MLWRNKIEMWEDDPVTKAFKAEIARDLADLTNALIQENNLKKIFQMKGMIKALQGVLDMGHKDPMEKPKTEE